MNYRQINKKLVEVYSVGSQKLIRECLFGDFVALDRDNDEYPYDGVKYPPLSRRTWLQEKREDRAEVRGELEEYGYYRCDDEVAIEAGTDPFTIKRLLSSLHKMEMLSGPYDHASRSYHALRNTLRTERRRKGRESA